MRHRYCMRDLNDLFGNFRLISVALSCRPLTDRWPRRERVDRSIQLCQRPTCWQTNCATTCTNLSNTENSDDVLATCCRSQKKVLKKTLESQWAVPQNSMQKLFTLALQLSRFDEINELQVITIRWSHVLASYSVLFARIKSTNKRMTISVTFTRFLCLRQSLGVSKITRH
jgi:hypothetical protein